MRYSDRLGCLPSAMSLQKPGPLEAFVDYRRRHYPLIGLVYAELGAALPRTGGIIRYPVYTHGHLVGYLISFITIVAYTSLISIEVTAVRQYVAYWFPGLTIKVLNRRRLSAGFAVCAALFVLLLNYWSVKAFAKSNLIISVLSICSFDNHHRVDIPF
ncbi:amino acid permease [Bacillus licheniformis]|nr:amino acid permease [Bacillus licheniformis]